MSLSQETLDKLKNQLKQIKDLGTPIKSDLYQHLTEVFNRIMLHHQHDGFDKFEEISALVKYTNFKIKDPKEDFEVNRNVSQNSIAQYIQAIDKVRNLLNEVPDLVASSDKKLVSEQLNCVIPNFPEQQQMLEWAGISFGEDRAYLIQKSLKRLAKVTGASSIKLFGKILCTQKDYWVAEGILKEQEESPTNPQQELRGQGANQNVFWVTNDLINDWIQLPEVQPHHIIASRMIKKILTGNLNAEIDSQPPFPGKEKHLLRAQIARIQHGTSIVPKGLFEIDEESQEVKFTEEPPAMGTEELKSLENWSHQYQILLKAGRCTHKEPAGISEEEKEEYMAKLNEEDKTEERFKTINENKPVEGREGAWISKVCGDTQVYKYINEKKEEATTSYAVNVFQSLRWPGSVTVAKGGNFCTIYVGDSIKRGDTCFNPTEPPEVQKEPIDSPDQPEPQGKDPPPKKDDEQAQDPEDE